MLFLFFLLLLEYNPGLDYGSELPPNSPPAISPGEYSVNSNAVNNNDVNNNIDVNTTNNENNNRDIIRDGNGSDNDADYHQVHDESEPEEVEEVQEEEEADNAGQEKQQTQESDLLTKHKKHGFEKVLINKLGMGWLRKIEKYISLTSSEKSKSKNGSQIK